MVTRARATSTTSTLLVRFPPQLKIDQLRPPSIETLLRLFAVDGRVESLAWISTLASKTLMPSILMYLDFQQSLRQNTRVAERVLDCLPQELRDSTSDGDGWADMLSKACNAIPRVLDTCPIDHEMYVYVFAHTLS